jgi:hypothetical protein
MRTHGEPEFPEPENGHLNLKVTKGGPLDPSSQQFKSAQAACKSLAPAGLAAGSAQSPTQQNAALQFANCMRSHGVPNFPDPQANGGFLVKGGAEGVNPNSPQFQSAMQSCRSLLPGGGTTVAP